MSQEMGLMELTPRGSKDLHNHYRKTNHIAPSGSYDKTTNGFPQDHGIGNLVLEAARNGNPQELEALLRDGVNPNVINGEGKSPLHLTVATGCSCDVCTRDAEACLVLLLSSNGVDVNLQDETGNTALHLAIDNQLSKCAQMLISYGADVNLRNDQGTNVVQLLARKMPHCLLHLLNESIYIDQFDPHHEKCVVKMDLGPLVGHSFSIDSHPNTTEIGKNRTKKKHSKEQDEEMTLLAELLENSKVSHEPLLIHPLVQVFLHLKWKRVRGFFWSSLIFNILWVIMYTSYVLQVYVFSCPCQLFMRTPTPKTSPAPQERNFGDDTEINSLTLSRCEIETGLSLKVIIIIVSAFLLLLTELGRLIITPRIYLRSWLNLGHWTLIICVFATTLPNLQAQTSISALQYQVAAFTVFFAFAFLLPQIGRLPSLTKYVEIFGHVVKCFGSFILTFAPLFMGFALAFCILFFGDKMSPFANFFHSSVKVFVMMVGEMDYMDMFYGDNNQQQPVMGHLLYATFVILICIILMNLFVGLTVSDIQMLERQAEFSRTCRLIVEIYHFESVVLSKRLPKTIRRFLKKIFLLNSTSQSFRANDPKDKSIPPPLSRKILQLAEISFKKAKSQRCFRTQSEPEFVEIQTYYPTMDKPEHDTRPSTSSSSSPSSKSSSPLETNSLDLDVNHTQSRGPYRPWASCMMDHRNYH